MQWEFELLLKPSTITEGPVWDGEHVYFTHIQSSRILRYDPRGGAITEWRGGINRVNGLAFDAQGRLFGCWRPIRSRPTGRPTAASAGRTRLRST